MPRLRKPPSDADAVTIDIPDDALAGSPAPSAASPATKAPEAAPGPDVHAEPESKVEEPVPPEEEENSLAKQVEQLKQAEANATALAVQERQRRIQVEQYAEQQRHVVNQSQHDVAQAQYDWVLSTLAATQTESESAQRDLEVAWTAGDPRGASDAQKRLARAEYRAQQLEDAKANFEQARQYQVNNPQPQQPTIQTPSDPVDQLTQLTQRERDWLRTHRDALTEPSKQDRLRAAYWDAIEAGHPRDSAGYFQFLEERLGYRGSPKKNERSTSDPDEGRGDISLMPVSRDAPPSARSAVPNRVTLTPQQREIARNSMGPGTAMNLSGADAEREYARQLIRMMRDKETEGRNG